MYEFLDRPVTDLPPGDQMLLWSMRNWVGAMSLQKCPCSVLGPAFRGWRVEELLRDFNMAMFLLNAEGMGRLRFGHPGCAIVHDDEAILLSLFHAAACKDQNRVHGLAEQLVKPEMAHAFIVALTQASDVLRRTPVPRGSTN